MPNKSAIRGPGGFTRARFALKQREREQRQQKKMSSAQ